MVHAVFYPITFAVGAIAGMTFAALVLRKNIERVTAAINELRKLSDNAQNK